MIEGTFLFTTGQDTPIGTTGCDWPGRVREPGPDAIRWSRISGRHLFTLRWEGRAERWKIDDGGALVGPCPFVPVDDLAGIELLGGGAILLWSESGELLLCDPDSGSVRHSGAGGIGPVRYVQPDGPGAWVVLKATQLFQHERLAWLDPSLDLPLVVFPNPTSSYAPMARLWLGDGLLLTGGSHRASALWELPPEEGEGRWGREAWPVPDGHAVRPDPSDPSRSQIYLAVSQVGAPAPPGALGDAVALSNGWAILWIRTGRGEDCVLWSATTGDRWPLGRAQHDIGPGGCAVERVGATRFLMGSGDWPWVALDLARDAEGRHPLVWRRRGPVSQVGRRLLTWGKKEVATALWDPWDGDAQTAQFSMRVKDSVKLPEGRLATLLGDRRVVVWEVRTGRELHDLVHGCVEYEVMPHLVALPDARVITWTSRSIALWDGATGDEIRRITGHGGGLCGVAALPDGRFISWALGADAPLYDQDEELHWYLSPGAELGVWDGRTGQGVVLNAYEQLLEVDSTAEPTRMSFRLPGDTVLNWTRGTGTKLTPDDGRPSSRPELPAPFGGFFMPQDWPRSGVPIANAGVSGSFHWSAGPHAIALRSTSPAKEAHLRWEGRGRVRVHGVFDDGCVALSDVVSGGERLVFLRPAGPSRPVLTPVALPPRR